MLIKQAEPFGGAPQFKNKMIYHGLFTSKQDVIYEFGISDSQLEGFEILYAEYTAEGYEGDAFVLLRKDGKYFEINGSHCSCNGLESQ